MVHEQYGLDHHGGNGPEPGIMTGSGRLPEPYGWGQTSASGNEPVTT